MLPMRIENAIFMLHLINASISWNANLCTIIAHENVSICIRFAIIRLQQLSGMLTVAIKKGTNTTMYRDREKVAILESFPSSVESVLINCSQNNVFQFLLQPSEENRLGLFEEQNSKLFSYVMRHH